MLRCRHVLTNPARTAVSSAVQGFGRGASQRRAAMASDVREVTIRLADGRLRIELTVGGRDSFMDRDPEEPLRQTLYRIGKNASKGAGKASKKLRGASPKKQAETAAIQLFADADCRQAVSEEAPNQDAWQGARMLMIGDDGYRVRFNPPTVQQLEAWGKAYVSIPICSCVQLHCADWEASQWQWARSEQAATKASEVPDTGWVDIPGAETHVYTPRLGDAGKLLRVTCRPAQHRAGGAVEAGTPRTLTLDHPVAEAPQQAALEARWQLTAAPLEAPGLRVVTYNILADQYAATEKARTVLFSYCPQEYMEPWRRRTLTLNELLRYNADIVCLQEVDEKAYQRYFEPQLKAQGFGVHYLNKAGPTREGEALFWRRARFSCRAAQPLAMRQLFAQLQAAAPDSALAARHAELLPMLRRSPALCRSLAKVSTVAQLLLLEPVQEGGVPVCVANTHLFFHPRAAHIRTMCTAAIVEEALAFMQAEAREAGWQQAPTLLLCGDLNSDRNDGMPGNVEMLVRGSLPGSHWDWQAGADFSYSKWEGEDAGSSEAAPSSTPGSDEDAAGSGDEVAEGQPAPQGDPTSEGDPTMHPHASSRPGRPQFLAKEVRLSRSLCSADRLNTPWTNYVGTYTGALDYVFHEPGRVAVRREVPLPPEEALQGFIPSSAFPSDHLAVVFDLEVGPPATNQDDPTAANSSQQQDHQAVKQGPGSNVLPAQADSVAPLVAALNMGQVVAVPTDTLYGLAADASSKAAVEAIYAIKGRQAHVPLAVCLAEAAKAPRYGHCEHLPQGLLPALLPGPVTMLLRRKADAPLAAELTSSSPLIGLRVPDSAFVRDVCRSLRRAVALTSANLSGEPSPLAVGDFEHLWSQCAWVGDAGQLHASREGSTVVDLSQKGCYSIRRAGNHAEQTCSILSHHGLAEMNSQQTQ